MDFSLYGKWVIKGAIIAAAAAAGFASARILGDDNPVEEQCEQVIQDETGLNVDLTPTSPEQGVAK